jgi:hypothetical protein
MRAGRAAPRGSRRAADATWGSPAPPPAERSRMQLLAWKPMRKGKLLGFARVLLPIGLQIGDIPVLAGRNGAFAALPAKPQIDSQGRVKRDDRGKAFYVPVLEWRDRDLSSRFSDTVVALVLEAHPDAFDENAQ